MICPSAAIVQAKTMLGVRLLVLPLCHEFPMEKKNAAKYGGAVRSRVIIGVYPRVSTIEGKKSILISKVTPVISKGGSSQVKLIPTIDAVWIKTRSHTFGSMRACLRPMKTDSSTSSFSPETSCERRYEARARSSGVSHGVFWG